MNPDPLFVTAIGGICSGVCAVILQRASARTAAVAEEAAQAADRRRLQQAIRERLAAHGLVATGGGECCGCTWDNHSHVLFDSPCLDCPDCTGWVGLDRPGPTRVHRW